VGNYPYILIIFFAVLTLIFILERGFGAKFCVVYTVIFIVLFMMFCIVNDYTGVEMYSRINVLSVLMFIILGVIFCVE